MGDDSLHAQKISGASAKVFYFRDPNRSSTIQCDPVLFLRSETLGRCSSEAQSASAVLRSLPIACMIATETHQVCEEEDFRKKVSQFTLGQRLQSTCGEFVIQKDFGGGCAGKLSPKIRLQANVLEFVSGTCDTFSQIRGNVSVA